jgi:hypothetical protein
MHWYLRGEVKRTWRAIYVLNTQSLSNKQDTVDFKPFEGLETSKFMDLGFKAGRTQAFLSNHLSAVRRIAN